MGVEDIRKWRPLVSAKSSLVMVNGLGVKFWKDIWCVREPLSVPFRSLFSIAAFENSWVRDLWCGT